MATLHVILEDAAKQTGAPKGSPEQLVGDLYASAMDSVRADKEGAKPLEGELGQIAAIDSKDALIDEIGRLEARGVRVPFAVGVQQDAKNSTVNRIHFAQAGLGLPDRDYYTKDDDASKKLRDQYVAHVTRIFGLLGDSPADAAAHAQTVMTMETRLARYSMTRVQRRDQNAIYHMMPLDTVAALAPQIAWPRLFAALGTPYEGPVNIGQPQFFRALGEMTADGARRLADLPALARGERERRLPELGFRQRAFRLLRQDTQRRDRVAAALEARARRGRRRRRRGARPALREEELHAGREGARARDDREHARRAQ